MMVLDNAAWQLEKPHQHPQATVRGCAFPHYRSRDAHTSQRHQVWLHIPRHNPQRSRTRFTLDTTSLTMCARSNSNCNALRNPGRTGGAGESRFCPWARGRTTRYCLHSFCKFCTMKPKRTNIDDTTIKSLLAGINQHSAWLQQAIDRYLSDGRWLQLQL